MSKNDEGVREDLNRMRKILLALKDFAGVRECHLFDRINEKGLSLRGRTLGRPVHAQLEGVHL